MHTNSVKLKDDIVEIHVVGEQTAASVTEMGNKAEQLLKSQGRKGQPQVILDDITELGRTDIAARQTVSALASSLPYSKVAMLGDGSVVMRVATNLLLRAIGKGDKIRYFEDREQAKEWLLAK